MAAEGHDILSIMFELGHASPDMASMYVNKRLDLKKGKGGQTRMADITRKRLQRNKDAVQNTDTIIRSIEARGLYKGEKQRYRPAAAREEVTS